MDNSWSHIATMQEPRAFASSVVLDSQYIYLFGGMHDLQILSTIEKYDTITDTWITVFFTLPKPLAKLGTSLLDRTAILICGGMSSDFEAKKDAFTFDLHEQKWRQVSDMACPKLVSSGQVYSMGQVYVFGGTADQICEKYDPVKDEWA